MIPRNDNQDVSRSQRIADRKTAMKFCMVAAMKFCTMFRQHTGCTVKPEMNIGFVTVAAPDDALIQWFVFFDVNGYNEVIVFLENDTSSTVIRPREENNDLDPEHVSRKVLDFLVREGAM